MNDFSIISFINLLKTLKSNKYRFQPFEQQLNSQSNKVIILRHDVDSAPKNSLRFAKIESDFGIKGTYYFRSVPGSFDEKIIREIYSLGHEIGYHYEDLGKTAQRHKGAKAEEELAKIAIESFKENLAKLRKIVPVTTICMHGSPMSRWDNRLLWKYFDYRDFGIIGEPYFDIDFNEVLYLTDTGRRWDGDAFNVRDKVHRMKGRVGEKEKGREENRTPHTASRKPFPKFHSTFDIIKAAEQGELPAKIMMTFHPQRWTNKPIPWVKELMLQNVKNVGKYFLVKTR